MEPSETPPDDATADDGNAPLETDPRFPTGPWTGFFIQKHFPAGKHWMELDLLFRDGRVSGTGRDRFGEFLFRGYYQLDDGVCMITKSYVKKHNVFYRGFNEGKGIWGVWQIPGGRRGQAVDPPFQGGFHIWPVGMSDPSGSHLKEEIDVPSAVREEELIGV